jgi:hypothetical protein
VSETFKVRNISKGPWRHSSTQEVVLPNGIFEASAAMVERMRQRRQLGIRFEVMESIEALDEGLGPDDEDDEGEEEEEEEEEEEWPLKMAPSNYARLHPEGQHADLARRLIAAAEEE